MTRPMTQADLGDPRLYEDEAIREQAVRLQIHVNHLRKNIAFSDGLSLRTVRRINGLSNSADEASREANGKYRDTL